MPNYVATAPADPVAGQPGHLSFSQWVKDSILILDALLPVGGRMFWGSASPPEGWAICDGSAHGSVALEAHLGSPNTPDLRGKFPLIASASRPLGSTGGAETVTLTAAQSGLPAHNHSASASGSTGSDSHTHTFSGTTSSNGTHSHGGGYVGNYMIQGSDSANNGIWFVTQTEATLYTTYSSSGNHNHTYSGTTSSDSHSHTISVSVTVNNNSAANASQSHENMPPYVGMHMIIKK